MNTILQIQPDEKIVLKFRKHWFIFFLSILPTLLLGIAPFILFPFLFAAGVLPEEMRSPALISFASAWWLIVVWSALSILWTNYYLDLWVITDRRIINIDQVSLFDRVTTTWRLDRVQEVTIGVQNIFETLLGYGSIEVQTAGPTDEFATIRGIRDPEYIQRVIMTEVDHFDPGHLSR